MNVTGGSYVGGLVGWNDFVTINNSYSTGTVSGTYLTGGLVGDNIGTINTSYSAAVVTNRGSGSNYFGGLVGANDNYFRAPSGVVNNSYSIGAVSGGGASYVGGLMGANFGIINTSYSTGAVSNNGVTSLTGGLVGGSPSTGGFGFVTGSYWDTQTSGQLASGGGTGMTTAQMQQQATYPTGPTGWDFVNVWQITNGASYPTLRVFTHKSEI